jgi:NTE family protein
VFDTAQRRVELDHIIASAGLIPDFQPVEIDGRLLVDGGLSANLPLHLILQPALEQRREHRLTCFAADLFPRAAPLPKTLPQAAQRESDLIFASQTARLLQALTHQWQDQTPGADIILTAYQALDSETALKSYDFTAGSLTRRRAAGLADMTAMIAKFRAAPANTLGLAIHAAPEAGAP